MRDVKGDRGATTYANRGYRCSRSARGETGDAISVRKIISRHVAVITSRPPPNHWYCHEMQLHEYLLPTTYTVTAGAQQGWPDKECADSCCMTSVLGVPKIPHTLTQPRSRHFSST